MKKAFVVALRFAFLIFLKANAVETLIDLEETWSQDFISVVKKIEIPGYPYAFNPSIIRWRNSFLMSFRFVPSGQFPFTSYIGLVWLDDNFNPLSQPEILPLRDPFSLSPQRTEDARLIAVNGKLFIVYSDNSQEKVTKGGFRIHIAELDYADGSFVVKNITRLSQFEGENKNKREKNWVPFDYKGHLLLSYSIVPHKVMMPSDNGSCQTLASTLASIDWEWGELRGGTAALLEGDEYLSFFHSSLEMKSLHSDGKKIPHYFIGAYTFRADPPFSVTKLSAHPIVHKGFYNGTCYKFYWKPVQVVFPCGYFKDNETIWLTYGRQDHEIWIAKIDKHKLLNSLIPVTSH